MTRQTYEFGPFRIDSSRRILRRDGEPVALTPKCFDILLALVESGGEVVSKDDLMKRVWPDSFVEEGNLTYNISILRKTLGEQAGEHQYVLTMPGRGYQFVAPVKEFPEDAGQRDEILAPKSNRRALSPALALVIIGIALTGIGYGLYRFINRAQPATLHQDSITAPFHAMKMTSLTTGGKVADVVISPDGKYVAYVTGEEGHQGVWVRQVATASNVQVIPAVDAGYFGLTFSLDGNFIYSVRNEKNSAMAYLYQTPTLGGASKRLIADVDSRITFSPDGKRLAFIRFSPLEKLSTLVIANADGSSEQRLAARRGCGGFAYNGAGPAWSPDGRTIACAAANHDANGNYINIISVNVDDGEQKPIATERWADVGRIDVSQIAWLHDGSGLVIALTDQVSLLAQLWFVSYPGGEARRITNDLSDYRNVSLSADSSAMAAVHTVRISSLWIVAEGGDATRAKQLATDKSGADVASNPDTQVTWAPDSRIVFTSNKSGNQDIWIMDSDGSNQKQLTVDAGANFSPTVSPDGRYIVFASDRAGALNIWRMDADGANAKRLTDGSYDNWARCSSHGRWVFYGGTSFGKPMISRIAIDGGESIRLSEKFLGHPAVSPDGKLLACTYLNEAQPESPFKIAVVSSEQGEIIRLLGRPPNTPSLYGWTADGRAVMYIDTCNGVSNIWSQSIDGGPPKQVTNFNSDRIFQFDWSRDGKQLLCTRGVETSDVVLITNFR